MKTNLPPLDVPAHSYGSIDERSPEARIADERPLPPAHPAFANLRPSPAKGATSARSRLAVSTQAGTPRGKHPASSVPLASPRFGLKRQRDGDSTPEAGPATPTRQRRADLPSPRMPFTPVRAAPPRPALPPSQSYRRSISFMSEHRVPEKPRAPFDPSESGRPDRMLRAARRHRRQASGDQIAFDTLSPSLVATLSQEPIKQTLAAALAAMKPGAAEANAGFRQVRLAGSPTSLDAAQSLKQRLGSGRYGTAYSVRLSEDLIKNGKNLGREFVFKAILRTDPHNPLPRDLYAALRGDLQSHVAAIESLIREKKQSIINEFQITAALTRTAHVMQVYELVEIDGEFGILCEKIDGENVRELIDKGMAGLGANVITDREYVELAKQVVADVLIAIARCADEGVAHSDISISNVMYDRDQKIFKLIDMGNGTEMGKKRQPGTKGYTDLLSMSIANERSDIYSAGQLFAHFLKDSTLKPGVRGFDDQLLTVEAFPFAEELAAMTSEDKAEMLSVVSSMVRKPPESRPSSEELLREPFFGQLTPRNQMHDSYEKLVRWDRSFSISTRISNCFWDIEDDVARGEVEQLLARLNELWHEDADEDCQGEIKNMLDKLHEPSLLALLSRAEQRQYAQAPAAEPVASPDSAGATGTPD